MTTGWRPSLEAWGLKRYFSAAESIDDPDRGPAPIGRVFGTENIAVEQALNRVAAADVSAVLPVPCRDLGTVTGIGIRSADTAAATPQEPVTFAVPILTGDILASGVDEPPLGPKQNQSVHPFGLLLRGVDAVLDTMSPYFKGSRPREKFDKKIVAPVSPATNVIAAGADLVPGAPLIHEGKRIGVTEMTALCMAGVRELAVYKRPRVAVCMIDKYFQSHEALDRPGANGMPDAICPMVLGLLARWGVTVDTVRHFDFSGRFYSPRETREINAIADVHDVTLLLGFLADDFDLKAVSTYHDLPPIQEPQVDGVPEDRFTRKRGEVRPHDIATIGRARAYWKEKRFCEKGRPLYDHCNVLVSLRGQPLQVMASMYTLVKPVLDAVSGVGAYAIQSGNHFFHGSPISSWDFSGDRRRQFLSRPKPGQSRRHGVRWLSGVLAAPAPRDPERHWLQLARIERNQDGRAALHVLPSEEYQVSGMIGAEAMVGIEKGKGFMPAGTVVEFFLLD